VDRKKKRKRRKQDRTPLSAADESVVASLLQTLAETDPGELAKRIPDTPSALAVIDRLPLEEASVPVLTAVHKTFPSKPVRKAVRRSLFKLKQKGISVPDLMDGDPSTATPLRSYPSQEPVAKVGAIGDMIGSRPVIVIIDQGARGQDLGIGLASDEEGISQFLYGSFSRRKVRELIGSILEGAGPLVDTTLSHALTILERAYQKHLERHPETPSEYLEMRPWLLDHADPLDHPIIYDHISASTLSDQGLTRSQVETLLEHDFLKSWLIDYEQLRPFMEDMVKADGSPILLTEAQKADRVQEIKEKSVEALFPRDKRLSLKHRLEETSYLFYRVGDGEMAELSLRAARTLDQEDTLLSKSPVTSYLLERSLRLYMKEVAEHSPDKPEPGESSSRIIVP
jgi:hypothetical protein